MSIKIVVPKLTLRKKLSVLVFSGPYSAQMQKNTDQKNSKYGHFSRSVTRQKESESPIQFRLTFKDTHNGITIQLRNF